MPEMSQEEQDASLKRIEAALKKYVRRHKRVRTAAKRVNRFCVRVRVIDPGFRTMNDAERFDAVMKALKPLAADDFDQVAALLLFTPAEAKKSPASAYFERCESFAL